MSKLFAYKREIKKPPKEEGGEPEVTVYTDYFNPEYVIRAMAFGEGLVVLLDDGHEASEEEPVKTKKGIEYQRRRNYIQSEIFLKDSDDIERFKAQLVG